jgi:hypothetical protein
VVGFARDMPHPLEGSNDVILERAMLDEKKIGRVLLVKAGRSHRIGRGETEIDDVRELFEHSSDDA